MPSMLHVFPSSKVAIVVVVIHLAAVLLVPNAVLGVLNERVKCAQTGGKIGISKHRQR